MDMKKVAFLVLVAAVCMTSVMAASRSPKHVTDDSPALAPEVAIDSDDDAAPTPGPVTKKSPVTSDSSTIESGVSTALPGDAPSADFGTEEPTVSSGNVVAGSLVGASFVSLLALYM